MTIVRIISDTYHCGIFCHHPLLYRRVGNRAVGCRKVTFFYALREELETACLVITICLELKEKSGSSTYWYQGGQEREVWLLPATQRSRTTSSADAAKQC